MNFTRKAKDLAREFHAETPPHGDKPFIVHPLRVAGSVQHLGPEYEQAALLHDIVEDTTMTLDALRAHGFSAAVVEAVGLLSRDRSVTYKQFVQDIADSGSVLAKQVKLADIEDHLEADDGHVLKDSMVKRYEDAKAILLVALA